MRQTCSWGVQYSHADMNQTRVWPSQILFSEGLDKFEVNIPLATQCPAISTFNEIQLLEVNNNAFLLQLRPEELCLAIYLSIWDDCLSREADPFCDSMKAPLLTVDHLKLKTFSLVSWYLYLGQI